MLISKKGEALRSKQDEEFLMLAKKYTKRKECGSLPLDIIYFSRQLTKLSN